MNATHPLAPLAADERAALEHRINLALDGETSWTPAIAFARNLTVTLVAQGRLTAEQADDIVDYARSF